MQPALVVSPHLDDAVLSVGQVMAGRPDMTVATVFSGVPKRCTMLTTYDHDCGFESAELAVAARRDEDRTALQSLAAHAAWLDFPDHQYGQPTNEAAIVDALAAVTADVAPTLLIGPLGLIHEDHHTTRRAFQRLVATHNIEAWIYEDMPYRVLFPEEVPEALAWWKGMGHRPELGFVGTGPLERKEAAIACYTSQLWALKALNEHCCLVPERLYRLWPAP
jgi:LmbE family N-acetylglucosaminyl deacetylase